MGLIYPVDILSLSEELVCACAQGRCSTLRWSFYTLRPRGMYGTEQLSCLSSAHMDHGQKRAAESHREEAVCPGVEIGRKTLQNQERRVLGAGDRVVLFTTANTRGVCLASRELGNP